MPHRLRHAFVPALLAPGFQITGVAKWRGHRNINVAYAIYGHLVLSSLGRALNAGWSAAA
jgi:site-specific recombinase XerD